MEALPETGAQGYHPEGGEGNFQEREAGGRADMSKSHHSSKVWSPWVRVLKGSRSFGGFSSQRVCLIFG